MNDRLFIEDRIDIALAPAEAFALVSDLDAVSRYVPGASLDPERPDDGGVRTGEVVFAFGPIRYRYRGTMTVKELAEADRRVTYEAVASETSGEGDLGADLGLAVLAQGSGSTLHITCDVLLTGMVADFGSGMVTDVAQDIFQQFGKAVKERYVDNPAATEPAAADAAGQGDQAGATAPAGRTPTPEAPAPLGGFGLMLRITRSRLRRLFSRIFGRSRRSKV